MHRNEKSHRIRAVQLLAPSLLLLLSTGGQEQALGDLDTSALTLRMNVQSLRLDGLDTTTRWAGEPVFLKFDLDFVFVSRLCPPGITLPIEWLEYKLIDHEGYEFFQERIDLYGKTAPGSLEVQPGITVPLGITQLTVQARLAYKAMDIDSVQCSGPFVESTVEATLLIDDVRTDLNRDARIPHHNRRRHILDSGRYLQWIWLEERDPSNHRNELLYHSRTLKVSPGQPPRVYIPWLRECGNARVCMGGADEGQECSAVTECSTKQVPGPWGQCVEPPCSDTAVCSDGENEGGVCKDDSQCPPTFSEFPAAFCGSACGGSVDASTNTLTVYASNENPLLSGGLAMAAYSWRAVRTMERSEILGRDLALEIAGDNLTSALKLLDYVEGSEWIDPEGNRTGFFLRSRWPGNVHQPTNRQYWFASIDEIVGMTYGLYVLHQGLSAIGDSENRARVEAIVRRLGNQLKNNYYLIVPLKRVSSSEWTSIGLPLERHKGYEGGYVLQWFLERGFRAITGDQSFEPPGPQLTLGHPFRAAATGLDCRDCGGSLLLSLVDLAETLSPQARASVAVQAAGIFMYLDQLSTYKVEIPCWFDQTEDVSDLDFPRFNFTMLVHAFQLGMAGPPADFVESATINTVRYRMAQVIYGLLDGGHWTVVDLKQLLKTVVSEDLFGKFAEFSYELAFDILDLVCDFEITFDTGSRVKENDYYAAVIAQIYNLAEELPDYSAIYSFMPNYQELFRAAIQRAKSGALTTLSLDLPVGERWVCRGGVKDGDGCNPYKPNLLKAAGTCSKRCDGGQFSGDACDDDSDCYSPFPVPDGTCSRTCDGGATDGDVCCDGNDCPAAYQCPGGSCESVSIVWHNPEGRIGNDFCWEDKPSKRVQDGGTDRDGSLVTAGGGLTNSTIGSVSAEGYGRDSMMEGSAVDYLLPNSMSPAIVFRKVSGTPGVPFLGACFTLPRRLGELDRYQTSVESPCYFGWPAQEPDPLDEQGRNDTPERASQVAWNVLYQLNIDRETHSAYREVPHAVYTASAATAPHSIPIEADYDYFTLPYVPNYDFTVGFVSSRFISYTLVVNDTEIVKPARLFCDSNFTETIGDYTATRVCCLSSNENPLCQHRTYADDVVTLITGPSGSNNLIKVTSGRLADPRGISDYRILFEKVCETSATVFPGAPQICDGINNDCDDANWPSLIGTNEYDNDGDGFLQCAGDCNDANPDQFPGQGERCNGIDDDCDGQADEVGSGDTIECGVGTCSHAVEACALCDSLQGASVEVCDGLDNNCDGTVPPGEVDMDVDGIRACEGDCDDSDPSMFPGAGETNDGMDNQCPGDEGYGLIDEISGNSGFNTAGDNSSYSIPPQPDATSYEVVRSTGPNFLTDCLHFSSMTTSVTDTEIPAEGRVYYYLSGASSPFVGSWGASSRGEERLVSCRAPDLIVVNLTHVPEEPAAGDLVTFTAVVSNVGEGGSGPSVLSFKIGGESPDNPAALFSVPALAPGESVSFQRWANLKAQSYLNTAVADYRSEVAESNEDNNIAQDSYAVGPARPDLEVVALTRAPRLPASGSLITFTVSVANVGTGTAGPSTLSFRIGEEPPDLPEALISVPALDPGEAVFFQRQTRLATGTYINTAVADFLGALAESNEDNNQAQDIYQVVASRPDLVIASLTHSPQVPVADNPILFTAVVKNVGEGGCGPSVLSFKVGGEPPDDPAALFSVPPLDSGQTAMFQRWVALPAGSYLNTAVADYGDNIAESNETNNQTQDSYVVVSLPDLVVESLTHSPESPVAGSVVTFTAVVRNVGQASAATSTLSFKVGGESPDTPTALFSVPALASGQSASFQRQATLSAGSYINTAVADYGDNIAESNETNNQTQDSYVVVSLPDLVVESLTHSPESPVAGSVVTFTAVVRNVGQASAATSTLSFKVGGESPDTPTALFSVPALASGQSASFQRQATLSAGSYINTAVADYGDNIAESNETNNQRVDLYAVQ